MHTTFSFIGACPRTLDFPPPHAAKPLSLLGPKATDGSIAADAEGCIKIETTELQAAQ